VLVITAKTERTASGSRGISAFLVETDAPGFELGKKEDKLGLRASDTRALSFQDCRIPKDALLGELHRGFPLFMKTLDGGRISIAALALGIGQSALDAAVPYSMQRRQFGQPICEFEMIQSHLAEMQTEITAARHLTYHAARLKDAGRRHTLESAMAKYYAATVTMKATTLARRPLWPSRSSAATATPRTTRWSATSATPSCARSARARARSRRSSSPGSW